MSNEESSKNDIENMLNELLDRAFRDYRENGTGPISVVPSECNHEDGECERVMKMAIAIPKGSENYITEADGDVIVRSVDRYITGKYPDLVSVYTDWPVSDGDTPMFDVSGHPIADSNDLDHDSDVAETMSIMADLLNRVGELLLGDRLAVYGDPIKKHEDIARAWGGGETASSVALKMMQMKIERSKGSNEIYDSLVDMVGYAVIYAASRLK